MRLQGTVFNSYQYRETPRPATAPEELLCNGTTFITKLPTARNYNIKKTWKFIHLKFTSGVTAIR